MGKENKEWKKELDEGMKWGVKCTVIIIWSLSAAPSIQLFLPGHTSVLQIQQALLTLGL